MTMMIFGAGVIGQATLRACRDKGIDIDCFVDERERGECMGLPIRHPREVSGRQGIYLTSPDLWAMVNSAKRHGINGWTSCTEVLRDHPDEHTRHLLEIVRKRHREALFPDASVQIASLDIVITERCTLKCSDCSNLMQYYERPQNSETPDVLEAIDRLCATADRILEARVIGGEPLVNKDCGRIVAHLTAKENVDAVAIFTNGTLTPKDWNNYRHPKVRFYITDYSELSRKYDQLVLELDARGIHYVAEAAGNWTACSTVHDQQRTKEENQDVFDRCCAKHLTTLFEGKLYRCPFSAHAMKLEAMPDYTGDYLNIASASKAEVRRFLASPEAIETCGHCAGRSFSDAVIEPGKQVKHPLKYVKFRRRDSGASAACYKGAEGEA